MKRKRSHATFIDQLRKTIATLRHMKPDETHVLTVHANYGNYEIVIGPERQQGKRRGMQSRPVEINGEIHHLFISPEEVAANPSKHQIHDKLKHTVIMQDLIVHLKDRRGDGRHAESNGARHIGIMARGLINMAGKNGEKLLRQMERSGELNDIAYHIIQQDILHALEKRRDEETVEV